MRRIVLTVMPLLLAVGVLLGGCAAQLERGRIVTELRRELDAG